MVPKIAMIAAPTAVSSSFALTCGAIVTTRAAPQIAVPHAVKIPSFFSTLNTFVSPYTTK